MAKASYGENNGQRMKSQYSSKLRVRLAVMPSMKACLRIAADII
jgi:hypothetical protein